MRLMVIIVCSVLGVVLAWIAGAFKAREDMDARETVSVNDPDFVGLEPDVAYLRYEQRRRRLTLFWPYYFLTFRKTRTPSKTRPS